MMKSVVYSSDPWFPSQESVFTLFAAITHDCNQQCLHCFSAEETPQITLDDKEWYALFDQLAELENSRLFFTGGEPLKHPSFLDFAYYASRKSIPIILGTNATLVTSSFSKNMSDAGIKEARVSLDGAGATSHELLRGIGAFDKTLKGIRLLLEAGIAVSIRTTVSTLNFHELGEIGGVVASLGVVDWEIKHIIPSGRALQHPELLTTPAERAKSLEEILNTVTSIPHLKVKLMEGTVSKDSVVPEIVKIASCPAGFRMMVVQPAGNVIPCGYLATHVIGNITQEPLKKSREKWETEQRTDELFLLPEDCKKCKHEYTCKGGCPAYNFCEEDV